MTERCKKCFFYGSTTDTCDFFLMTGERRGCPVERCVRFKSRTETRRPQQQAPKQIEQQRQMRKLHAQGLNDTEIAAQIGVSSWTVGQWRRKFDLPANARFGGDRKA